MLPLRAWATQKRFPIRENCKNCPSGYKRAGEPLLSFEAHYANPNVAFLHEVHIAFPHGRNALPQIGQAILVMTMQTQRETGKLPGYAKFALIALGIGLVLYAMVLAQILLVPLAWAVLLSLMVLPFCEWLERFVKNRALASIITVIALIIVVSGILVLLASQAIGLAKDTSMIAEKIASSIEGLRHFADENLGLPFDQQPEAFKTQLSGTMQSMLGRFSATLQHTVTTIALLVVVPMYMFFLLNYRELFTQFVTKMTLLKDQPHSLETMSKAAGIVQRYLRGAGIEVLIMGIMVGLLFLALGIRNALFFAVLIALLNIIPYIGVFIASVISVFYAYLTTDTLSTPILVFVCLWGIQIIDNNLIVPYVVGQQIKLNPLAVLLVVVLGGLVWGVSGMVIFIPMLGMLKVMFDESETLRPYGHLLGGKDEKKQVLPLHGVLGGVMKGGILRGALSSSAARLGKIWGGSRKSNDKK
jgi:predicted PurR-regulated permease PerM